jgi:hypothetical protein
MNGAGGDVSSVETPDYEPHRDVVAPDLMSTRCHRRQFYSRKEVPCGVTGSEKWLFPPSAPPTQ